MSDEFCLDHGMEFMERKFGAPIARCSLCEQRAQMNIKTEYWAKPIPPREFDWSAIDDRTYGGEPSDPIGYGATEQQAIDDLLEQIEEAVS